MKLFRTILLIIIFLILVCVTRQASSQEPIVLRQETTPTPTPMPTTVPTPTTTPTSIKNWQGDASYYSREGCVGCSASLRMANGQPLDDNALTVAFNRLPLGSTVEITNLKNQRTIRAVVTDRGGFERLGRIIDLTLRVKNEIGCSDLCPVSIKQVNLL